jgi:hypothetical protein
MSWFFKGPKDPEAARAAKERAAASAARSQAWEAALGRDQLPEFVETRLREAAGGRTPWLSTMTPAELLLLKSHGVRPLATVSGTCWYQYGYSWTEGHAEGWRMALARIKAEAVACGANAVVDVKMRTSKAMISSSMDYTLLGTAVRFRDLPPSAEPVVATVPALEFVRLLEAGIVPTGIAVGAHFEWLTDYNGSYGGNMFWGNQQLTSLGGFWESVRRRAHQELRNHARQQGTGVLAHTHFGQIIKQEVDKQPDRYLGRHIVIGTVVQARQGEAVPHPIRSVVDMRDDLSPLVQTRPSSHNAFASSEREGSI